LGYGWLRSYAISLKVKGSSPDEVIGFFNLPNPSNHTMALEFTQTLNRIEYQKISGGKARPASKADRLNANYELIV
jgi:hypothetical protein